ncbi:MAG: hypothetical protein ACYS9T_07220 [Planctomycetota bacterium]|jgi:hypothetical protein
MKPLTNTTFILAALFFTLLTFVFTFVEGAHQAVNAQFRGAGIITGAVSFLLIAVRFRKFDLVSRIIAYLLMIITGFFMYANNWFALAALEHLIPSGKIRPLDT